jgi:heme/copper-type cytochrome/quinol oxidase subunit 3
MSFGSRCRPTEVALNEGGLNGHVFAATCGPFVGRRLPTDEWTDSSRTTLRVMAHPSFELKGFRATGKRRLLCFSLFWQALDILWVWLFTVV